MSSVQALVKYSRLILVWGILLALLTGVASLVWPKQYSATSQVLLISRAGSGIDPYTQARSAGQIGNNLSEVMKTTDFYNKVFVSESATFDKSLWQNLTDRIQRKRWQKNVQASMVYNTSLMSIAAFSNTPIDAVALNQAVVDTVVGHGWEYIGGDVTLKVVNTPLASRFPVRPNIILNVILGFALGILLSGLWVAKYKQHTLFN